MDDLDGDDHGFVDMHDLDPLVTRIEGLETQFTTMNAILSTMTTRMNQLIFSYTLGMPFVPPDTAGAYVPPPSLGHTHSVEVLATPSLEAHNKNIKPPIFKGEEKERNKDDVNTFLHKWTGLHDLRRTSDGVCVLEASLSLEGKAYKWWMSLKVTDRPSTWSTFQEVFQKEFLPENEQDKNWIAWDRCQQDCLALTQYVSKYREIILKLEGLDDFRKLGVLLEVLMIIIRLRLKLNILKILEEAIKAAQIYDDLANKLNKPTIWGKSSSSNTFSKNVKHKNGGSSKEDTNKVNGKKPKGVGGPLTSKSLREFSYQCKACVMYDSQGAP